ncbi:MAG: type III-B CRISPR module RAMP protein Cmr4 [Armatimonadota bacterium]
MALTKMYWIHALTPVHVGSGSGVGFVDLPIMREAITGWPVIPGSAVKGVLADAHGAADPQGRSDEARTAFGIAGDEHSNSGALVFSDARLVCLPLRSFYGTFAWATSAMALRRLERDLKASGSNVPGLPSDASEALVCQDSAITGGDGKVYLGDLDFSAQISDDAGRWATVIADALFPGQNNPWKTLFVKRFVILPENEFNTFAESGTEVVARVRINQAQKTVAKGALWYEEYLPAESVLAGLIWCDRVFLGSPTPESLIQQYCSDVKELQIGGKATTGKGRVRCIFGGNHA